ncbi:alpha/beta hydrolase family protein [Aestuariibacter salexigens]|uniref:alpha/beta hydrolase family protein n=1 Tax=Aestuariibacter salexigens TaxID=226010 RepID=UPI00040D7D77|nr:alpha/beta hydrolase [Aestuariibacter salexigens]
MYYVFIIVVLFLTGCSGSEQSSQPAVEDFTQQPVARHYDFYERAGSLQSYASVLALPYNLPDAIQQYGADSLQRIEYWQATAVQGRESLPALVFVHGGCWSNSFRIDQTYPFATAMALNGFHVWSVEYRATGDPGGGWPGTFNDVQDALQSILGQTNPPYGQWDYVVIGHSAGGHLALLAASTLADNFDVVGLAAIVNFTDYARLSGSCSALARSFMNGSPDTIPEQYVLASPNIERLTGRTTLFTGGRDNIVPESEARDSGLPYQIDAEAGHFDWIYPGTESFDTLLFYLLSLD